MMAGAENDAEDGANDEQMDNEEKSERPLYRSWESENNEIDGKGSKSELLVE